MEEKNQAQVKAELISQAFVQQTKNPAFKEFTIEQVFAELQKFRVSNTNRDLRLRKQAQILTKDLNQFLLNRGKTKLTPRDLIAAYNNQVHYLPPK